MNASTTVLPLRSRTCRTRVRHRPTEFDPWMSELGSWECILPSSLLLLEDLHSRGHSIRHHRIVKTVLLQNASVPSDREAHASPPSRPSLRYAVSFLWLVPPATKSSRRRGPVMPTEKENLAHGTPCRGKQGASPDGVADNRDGIFFVYFSWRAHRSERRREYTSDSKDTWLMEEGHER